MSASSAAIELAFGASEAALSLKPAVWAVDQLIGGWAEAESLLSELNRAGGRLFGAFYALAKEQPPAEPSAEAMRDIVAAAWGLNHGLRVLLESLAALANDEELYNAALSAAAYSDYISDVLRDLADVV